MTLLATKYLLPKRSLIYIGGEILSLLREKEHATSDILDRLNAGRDTPISFRTVALALTFLYAIGSVVEGGGMILLANQPQKDGINADRD